MTKKHLRPTNKLEELVSSVAICPVSIFKQVRGGYYYHASDWNLEIRQKGVIKRRKLLRLLRQSSKNNFRNVRLDKWEFIPDAV